MTEKLQLRTVSPVEKCYVESGFCAYLVLCYDNPDSPRLEAMNSVSIIRSAHAGPLSMHVGFEPLHILSPQIETQVSTCWCAKLNLMHVYENSGFMHA